MRNKFQHMVMLIFCIFGLNTVQAATNFTSVEQTELVNAHDKWRNDVKVPPLTWSSSLADTAQVYADKLKNTQACKMVHSHANGLGENLFWASALTYSNGSSEVQVVSPTKAVDEWGSEKSDYNYKANACVKGKMCGHYTQVVWKDTTQVGCGKAVCTDNSQVWVCHYTPAGNFIGQKPY
ncbi:MAG: CAP domain-containing protein [Methylococcales bacterium]